MYFFKDKNETKLIFNDKKYLRYFCECIQNDIYLCKFKKCTLNLFFLTDINNWQSFYDSMDIAMATIKNDYDFINKKEKQTDVIALIINNIYIFNEEKIKSILDSLEVMNKLEGVK